MVEEMKVKEGYKMTEVGVIPEDWEVGKLENYVTIMSGESPSKFRFYNKGIPYFKVEQLNNSNKYQNETPYYIDTDKSILSGSIIFPKRGASILLNKIRILQQDSYMDTNLMTLTSNDEIDNEYLFYKLSFVELWKVADTTSVPQINNKHINPFKISVPTTINEQRLIAKVLSDIDNLIQSIGKVIDKKEKIKLGAMQELLTGKKRLDGFSGELEQIKLGSVGSCIRGVTYKTEEDLQLFDSKNTVKLLRSNNILDNRILFENMHIVNDLKVKDNQLLREEDIVICMANGSKSLVGKSGIFKSYDKERYTVGAFMSVYRVNTNIVLNEFISFYLQTNDYRNYINVLLAGSSINNLNPSDIESIDINIPQLNEQKAILNILSDMDQEIQGLKQKLEKYKTIKQGMMQELLTGRVRLI